MNPTPTSPEEFAAQDVRAIVAALDTMLQRLIPGPPQTVGEILRASIGE
jgi:hypothetical protein